MIAVLVVVRVHLNGNACTTQSKYNGQDIDLKARSAATAAATAAATCSGVQRKSTRKYNNNIG